MTIAYQPQFYNVVPRGGGYTLAIPYTAGDGFFVLTSVVGLPTVPFRLTIVTLASRGRGLAEVLAVYGITAVNTLTNTLTISGVLEGTSDRNFAIGDVAQIRINAGAITDLNAAATLAVPSIVVGVNAAGNSAGTATQLAPVSSVQEVFASDDGQGVLLPPIVLPSALVIINAGTFPILIYPQPGSTIYNSTSPFILNPSPPAAGFVASSPTNWYNV